MDKQAWERLRESAVKEYGEMLPARVVMEHNESDHSYRTYMETFSPAGEPGFMYGRYFYLEEEAAEDFNKRVRRL
jgi:hypothetical protein